MHINHIVEHFLRRRGPSVHPLGDYWPAFSQDGDRIVAAYQGLRLSSVYQPIVAADRTVLGYEALLRACNASGAAVSPESVFCLPTDGDEVIYLDRLCRTLHVLNLLPQLERFGGRLFLNVAPRHLLEFSGEYGRAFEEVLRYCGLHPSAVVLEVLEGAIDDDGRLLAAVNGYRSRGYNIAIDDFGRRHSNLDRLLSLQPHIVKLDRGLLLQAQADGRARRVLSRLADIVHDLDASVVIEGIEDPDQLDIALEAGADGLQGFLLGRPMAELAQEAAAAEGSVRHLRGKVVAAA